MSGRVIESFKALVLALFAIFFAHKLVAGTYHYYIGPRFAWLVGLAAILFAIMSAVYYQQSRQSASTSSHHHEHDHAHDHNHASAWPLVIVSAPLLLGVMVPASPLGVNAVANQGVSFNLATGSDAQVRLATIPAQRNILDWVRAMSANADPAALDGQAVDVVGFVYRDPRFAPDQFLASRFLVACCVADARAIGILVHSPQAGQFETGAWVRVRGVFRSGALGASRMPVVAVDEIAPAEQPTQPYLYP